MNNFKRMLTENVGVKDYIWFETSGNLPLEQKFTDWIENENDIMTVESVYYIGHRVVGVLAYGPASNQQKTKFAAAVEKKFVGLYATSYKAIL